MIKALYAFLIIANGYIWTSLYFEEPTQFVGRTNDGMYIHTNALTMRTYLTKDAHGLQVIRKAKCDSITTGEVITAYVNGHPITTIMGNRAYSENSWKINHQSKRKLTVVKQ